MSVKHYLYLPNSYRMRTFSFAVCNYILSIILRPCKWNNLFRSWLYWMNDKINVAKALQSECFPAGKMPVSWDHTPPIRLVLLKHLWVMQSNYRLCYFLFVHWKLPSPQTTLGCSCFRRLWVRTGPSDGTGITSGFMFCGQNQWDDDTAAKRDAFRSLPLCALV